MNWCLRTVLCTLSLVSFIQAHESGQREDLEALPRRATTSVPRPYLGSVPYGTAINNCAVPGAVALTFDDGPGPYTAELLDTLLANGIHATFFILGNRNGAGAIDQVYPDLIRRMYREGHQIASHTWDHQSLESLSSAQRITEMTENEAAFQNILGFFPTYMRPPYGYCYGPSGCLSDMGNLGYHVIDWSIDTKDYENDSPSLIINAKNRWDAAFWAGDPSTSSFIPLTHDIHQNTVENLAPYMISEIKQRGYKFLTVGECLNDPAENWYRDATTGQVVNGKGVQAAVSSNPASSSTSTSAVALALTSTSASISISTSVSAPTSSSLSSSISTSSTLTPVSTISSRVPSTASSSTTHSTTPTSSSTARPTANNSKKNTSDLVTYGLSALIFGLSRYVGL